MLETNRLYNIDCVEGMKLLDNNSIDMIFTDPPYGKEAIPLYESIANEGKRILKDGGFCVFYASEYWFDKIFTSINKHLDYYCLIHLQVPGQSVFFFPRNLAVGCKTLMVFSKGKTIQKKRINNFVVSPERKTGEHHKWQQSIEPAIKLIEAFSNNGDLILEPCVGSGTTLLACKQLHRRFIGFEKDIEAFNTATNRCT
jgi:DNA modification methylase